MVFICLFLSYGQLWVHQREGLWLGQCRWECHAQVLWVLLCFKNIFSEIEGHTFTYLILFFLKDGAARPMTAVRAAGYSSSVIRGKCANDKFCYSNWYNTEFCLRWFYADLYFSTIRHHIFLLGSKVVSVVLENASISFFSGSTFDPLGQSRGPAPPLEGKNEDTCVFWSAFIMPNLWEPGTPYAIYIIFI